VTFGDGAPRNGKVACADVRRRPVECQITDLRCGSIPRRRVEANAGDESAPGWSWTRVLCFVTALAMTSCAADSTTTPAIPPGQQVHERVLSRSIGSTEACLLAAVDAPSAAVAGIVPTTTSIRWRDGVRIEQWFITPPTHQRTVFELTPEGPDRTRVVVYLLQRHGQYEVGGFARSATEAVARCASPG